MKTLLAPVLFLAALIATAKGEVNQLWLVFSVANSIYNSQPTALNAGGIYQVTIVADGKEHVVHTVGWGMPSGVWLPQAVDMSAFAGKKVEIQLAARFDTGNPSFCFLRWGSPLIVSDWKAREDKPKIIFDLGDLVNQKANGWRFETDENGVVIASEGPNQLGTLSPSLEAMSWVSDGQAGPDSLAALTAYPNASNRMGWVGYRFDLELPKIISPGKDVPPMKAETASNETSNTLERGELIDWSEKPYVGCVAIVDPLHLSIETEVPAGSLPGYAYGAVELDGVKRCVIDVEKRLSPLLQGGSGAFAGILIDYSVQGKYRKRVYINLTGNASLAAPADRRGSSWNIDTAAPNLEDEVTRTVELVEGGKQPRLELNIEKYAPPGWDGRCWLGVGLQDMNPGSFFRAQMVSINGNKKLP